MEQGLNRRRFLGAAMGTGAAAATGALAPAAFANGGTAHDHGHGGAGSVPRDRRGIQLYSCATDHGPARRPTPRACCAPSARWATREVERAGTTAGPPQQFRA